MPTQKSAGNMIPKDGWVQELGDAESAAKKSRSARAQLRLAIAAYKLREYKKLKIAANLGLALDPSEGEKQLLKEYVEKSKERKEIRFGGSDVLEEHMRRPDANVDNCYFSPDSVAFTNLNILHYAAVTGDVNLVEDAVAIGAALDFSVSDEIQCSRWQRASVLALFPESKVSLQFDEKGTLQVLLVYFRSNLQDRC
jgi:hypothetical protein